MSAGLEDLYREVILDHHRHPCGAQPLETIDAAAEGKNPACGDEVKLELEFEGNRITGVSVRTDGCAIATASGSILAELALGRSLAEVSELARAFRRVMRGDDPEVAAELQPGDLEALTGVRQYPLRVKCALLPWITLLEAVATRQQQRAATEVTTEVSSERT